MNILYIGSSGILSLIPFKKLLSEKINVSAVGMRSPIAFDKKIITLKNESLALAANAANVPVIDLSQPVPKIIAQCEDYSIDVILMSCYSRRLPDGIIKLATKGCYNMHPSLLPRFRGPEPIFWQMKTASDMGVSWHEVVHDFDAGDIVVQKKILPDEGASYVEISLQLAETGAILMLELLLDLVADTVSFRTQDSAASSYFSYPQAADFEIELNESARQIYNFMSATQAFSTPYLCRVGNHHFYLDEALDYDNNSELDLAEVQGDRLYIPCEQGVLIATYVDKLGA